MQDERIKVWLEDIRMAIEEINDFIRGMDEYNFENDLKTRKAVERNITIIGEAMDRILKSSPGIAITDCRKIVNTRNRIMHGYESVSLNSVWLIIQNSLPVLYKEVKELLAE